MDKRTDLSFQSGRVLAKVDISEIEMIVETHFCRHDHVKEKELAGRDPR